MAPWMMIMQRIMTTHIKVQAPITSILAFKFMSDYSLRRGIQGYKALSKKLQAEKLDVYKRVSTRRLHLASGRPVKNYLEDNEQNLAYIEDASDSDGENIPENVLDNIFKRKTSLSDNEWEEVLHSFIHDKRFVVLTACDALVMKFCLRHRNLSLANSYLCFLRNKDSELNILAHSLFMQLCSQTIDECGEHKVLDIYRDLCNRVKVFDATLSEHAILSLTKTSEWKQSFKHLPMLRKLCSVPGKVYNALTNAAFLNGEYDTGWKIMEIMHKEQKEPFPEVLIEWINQSRLMENKESMMDVLFEKFRNYEIYPKTPAAEEIVKFFREDMLWSARYVKIDKSGSCPACGQQLETAKVDKESFINLKDQFVSRVLLGSDIFKSTSPEEWSRFKTFVEEEGPFSAVIDGLNVAYTVGKKSVQARVKRLDEVVTMLKANNPRSQIMVIGRKHMELWSPRDFSVIRRKAKLFMLDNISKDDGFFIYAALQSGLGTQFVTSDLLRDHIYSLGEVSLRDVFRQWQRKHQIFASSSAFGVQLMPPPEFSTAAQKHGNSMWHIPYNDGSMQESFEIPNTWLCLKATPHQSNDYLQTKDVREIPFVQINDKRTDGIRNSKEFTSKGLGTSNKRIRIGKDMLPKSAYDDARSLDPRRFSKDSRVYSSASRNYPQDDMVKSQSKGSGARNKMQEDIRKIMNNNASKQRVKSSDRPQSRIDKRQPLDKQKGEDRLGFKVDDIFKDS